MIPSCNACIWQHLGAYCVPELFQVLRMQWWTKQCAFWKLGRTDKQLKYRVGPMEKNQTTCEGEGGLCRWCSGQESACHCRRHKRCRFDPWVWKIPQRREWQPIPVFLSGKFHGQKGLAGYSPWGCKESDMTEWLSTHEREGGWNGRRGLLFYNSRQGR